MRKQIITLVITAIAGVTCVQAQETVKPTQDPAIQQQRAAVLEQRQAEASENTARLLGLDAVQTEKLKKIDADHAAAMTELRATGDREKISMEMPKLKEERDARIKDILTPEQYERLNAPRSSRPESETTPGR